MRVLLVLLASALTSSAGGFDGLWRYAHPDAQFLCGIEWSSISKSELANTLKSELAAGKSDFHGMEFVKELDRVLISSPGNSEWPGVNKPKEAPLLMVIVGKFDWPALRKQSTAKRYKTVEWLELKDSADEMQIGVLGPETLLVGDRKSLTEAIDRGLDAKTAAHGALYESGLALSTTHSLWFAAKSPATLTKSSGMIAAFANDIREVTGGVQFQNGLELDINLKAGQPAQAAKLVAAMQAMLTLQLASSNGPGPADFLRRIKVTQSGAAVQLALAASTKEIQASIKSAKEGFSSGSWMKTASAMNSPHAGVSSRAPQAMAAAKPPQKRVIRITGLDSGPREIPFDN
jgi:hypothetical protein